MTEAPPTSDAAVRKATGRAWDAWFEELDAAGAADWTHREIAVWIQENHGEVSGWWAQNLTVGYERARGLRATHEKKDGFAASCSRTFAVPSDVLYQAWADDAERTAWLGDAPHRVRSGQRGRSLNLDWEVDGSRVRAWFTAKGDAKCSVAVQQERLADAEAVAAAKSFWAEALDRLRTHLDS